MHFLPFKRKECLDIWGNIFVACFRDISELPTLPAGSNQSSAWSEPVFSDLFLGDRLQELRGSPSPLLTCNMSLNFSDRLRHLLRSIWCFRILCMRPALHIGNSVTLFLVL